MIFSENRFPLFRIMLESLPALCQKLTAKLGANASLRVW
jgi:hypothetical protein